MIQCACEEWSEAHQWNIWHPQSKRCSKEGLFDPPKSWSEWIPKTFRLCELHYHAGLILEEQIATNFKWSLEQQHNQGVSEGMSEEEIQEKRVRDRQDWEAALRSSDSS